MILLSNLEEKKEQNATKRLAIQLRFKLARYFLNPLNSLIQLGYSQGRKNKTAIGKAMSHTLRNAMEGDYPNIWVNPTKVRFSVGTLCSSSDIQVERIGNAIRVTWRDETKRGRVLNGQWDDTVIFCAYDVEAGVAGINEVPIIRRDEQHLLQLPSGILDRPVHLYMMLHDRDKKAFSNSLYLGLY